MPDRPVSAEVETSYQHGPDDMLGKEMDRLATLMRAPEFAPETPERSTMDRLPLPADLPDYDDPLVVRILAGWQPYTVMVGRLRHYVDANQRVLLARLAAWAVSRDLDE